MPTRTDITEDRIVDSSAGLLGSDPVLGDLFEVEVIS
jgi:hypothetical protein